MNLSEPFIRRPIATTLLTLGVVLAGFVAFNLLPVAPLPQIDFPTVSVSASLPGASPEVMASAVATPLEKQLGSIAGITEITSINTLGSTRVTLQFDLSRDINSAARDVQAAINAALTYLPTDLPNLPSYKKVNPADAPIMIIALTSEKYSTGEMYDIADTILQQSLSQVAGIGQVTVGGSSRSAVRIELNPTIMNHYGISPANLATFISQQTINRPVGQIQNGDTVSNIKTNNQLLKAKDYAPLIVAYNNNSPVRMADIADSITDSVQDLRNLALANGQPAIVLVLYKEPNANVIETMKAVNKILPTLADIIPKEIKMKVMMDRTQTIQASLTDVEVTLVLSMILVVLVTYFFLGSVRAMLIPGIAVPLSLLGTFAIMKLLNYSLDNLSLMALTIATGFVVDDAVVVLENIARHLEMRVAPLKAALDGAREVGFTVLSMSLSLVAVFIPILFMSGLVGRLFREFAVTLSVAILISLIVSLTVTPMMCSRLLQHGELSESHSFVRYIHAVRDKYGHTLQWALKHSHWVLGITVFMIFLNIILCYFIPKGFFPQQDTGRISASIQGDQNISFGALSSRLYQYAKIIQDDPGVENVSAVLGGTVGSSGSIFITLKPLSQRNYDSADKIINRLRSKLATVLGSKIFLQAAQDIFVGGRQSNSQFLYTLSADSLSELTTWSPKVVDALSHNNAVTDVSSSLRDHGLQEYIQFDRNALSRFGLTMKTVDQDLYSSFGQRQVAILYKDKNQYHVVMEVAPKYWQRPETLDQTYFLSSAGVEVPLKAVAKYKSSSTFLAVEHQNLAPVSTISFNLLPGYSLKEAINIIDNIVTELNLPDTIRGSYEGTTRAFMQALSNEGFLILAALLAIYIILGVLYESFIHPITILSTLPSAGVGALLALMLTGTELSLIAIIGILLLIGLVKKNAIMMIDFALEAERVEKKSPKEAIYEAALLRFRPIMMTTMAAILGAIPLVIGIGLGSEFRRPLGISIIGGLLVSQVMTLYSTPVIYLAMEDLKTWIKSQRTYKLGWINET
jgi:multidrug efflux pump